ncbi:putative elongator complex protein 1 [Cephus cinctus]|uniref:Elongator complex protein 1 n=1 Tax=Cephus cinctus TaxID=211228 RepID=A0AAJ7FU37_CEPCN|nr:putative elongator complex protein 1 [Cephus cinctus]
MKNLTVLYQNVYRLEEFSYDELCHCTNPNILCCNNPDNDDLYILKGNNLFVINYNSKEAMMLVKVDIDDNAIPVGLEYCSTLQQVFCAYDSGALCVIDTELRTENGLGMKNSDGIQRMKLSPDQEILILVTGSEIVVTMTTNFQIISEVDLNAPDFGEKQFVTVGWGKKETQFHGSEGKAAAKSKPAVVEKIEFDNGIPRITWRGDGTLFAVSILLKETGIRCFKVFNRQGIVQYTSETINGLEEHLSWRPLGNLIASTQRLPNKHVIAFFEKNGLKHGDFSLPFEPKEINVKEVLWSNDSDILTVWCEKIIDGTTLIQLWTQNNYHWYLKQTISFPKENAVIYLSWSSMLRCGKRLHILTAQNLITYMFRWVTDGSRAQDVVDKALVGVIDGNKALLTGFRIGIVPPPMAHQVIQMDQPINSIVFGPDNRDDDSWINSNGMFCVLSNNQIVFYEYIDKSVELKYNHVTTCDINWEVPKVAPQNMSFIMHHFLWFKKNKILCSVSLNTHSFLCILRVDGLSTKKDISIAVEETHVMDGLIEHIVPSPNKDTAYIVVEGSVFKYSEHEGIVPTEVVFPESCSQVQVVRIGKKLVIVSRTERNRLYIDGKEVANNITSLCVHTEFLLLTTLQHALICVTLDERGFEQLFTQDFTVKPWENECDKTSIGFSVRRVERGSNLILAVPKDTRTILQMPRGNLECIQPRALLLYIIGNHLDNLNYFAAFEVIRKQRINLNLIYDHDPSRFIQNAKKFIEDVKKPSWLSVFLSELQDEDVSTTIYASCYPDRMSKIANTQSGSLENKSNKVELVCALLRDIMENCQNADKLIQPILTSLVKRQELKGLEAALGKIKQVKKVEDEKNDQVHNTSEEALKYLLYLVDVNVLFNVALGMYDFDLTMFVASKSQKDPKEYIPLLNGLKNLEENYMKYSIDKHLKRYESALKHISKIPEKFNECIELIRNHRLYVQALKLFDKNSEEYKDVAKLFGEYLLGQKKYREAAIMFCRSDNLQSALNAYKFAGNWQEAIIIATRLKLNITDLHILYEDLVSKLKDDRRYVEAAEILINHLQNIEDTVATLCEGKKWSNAMRIAYSNQRKDLIETHVKPGVQEHADYLLSQINKYKEDFEKHTNRLNVVRAEKAAKQMHLIDGDEWDHEAAAARGDSDLFSDTSSVAGSLSSRGSQSSRSSGRSYRSSKNRRKHERKLLSMKEGSAYEDLGLIRTLHQLVINAYGLRGEIHALSQVLMHFYEDECAQKLQNCLTELLSIVKARQSEIWNKDSTCTSMEMRGRPDALIPQLNQINMPENLIEPHLMIPPAVNMISWQLDLFSSSMKPGLNT